MYKPINIYIINSYFSSQHLEYEWRWRSINYDVNIPAIPDMNRKQLEKEFLNKYDFCVTGDVSLIIFIVLKL